MSVVECECGDAAVLRGYRPVRDTPRDERGVDGRFGAVCIAAECSRGGRSRCGRSAGGAARSSTGRAPSGVVVLRMTATVTTMAPGGRPRSNQAQNRQFADAVREAGHRLERPLTRAERRRLHDELRDLDLGYSDIVELAIQMFGDARRRGR